MRIYINFKLRDKKRIYLYIIVVFINSKIILFKNFKNNILSKLNYFDRLCIIDIDKLHLCNK